MAMEPQKGSAGKAVPGSGNGAAVVHLPAAVWGGSVELCSHCGAGNALSAAGTGGWMWSYPRQTLH